MGSVWAALLVGGGLAGALFIWLLRGDPPGTTGRTGTRTGPPSATFTAGGGGSGLGRSSRELSWWPFYSGALHLQVNAMLWALGSVASQNLP
uniref:Uncharacterized protein n=1 Tax=Spermophilus dauricus TaxID=99837 RepID=A0A8C9UND0_SPEDA